MEGSPLSLLEALASAKCIIASNIPSIREIVEDHKEALLFSPHNSKELKDAIATLYYSEMLRKELMENARLKAKRYDLDTLFPQILHIFSINHGGFCLPESHT